MTDRREQILARITEIAGTVPGIVKVYRNAGEITARARPAINVLDGSENSTDNANRPKGVTKDVMTCIPQIFIMLGDRTSMVGTSIGAFRALLVPAIWQDAAIREIVGVGASGIRNGDIRYTGCSLETFEGENREARMSIEFEFTYILDCEELKA